MVRNSYYQASREKCALEDFLPLCLGSYEAR
jgi:hypothetical protein